MPINTKLVQFKLTVSLNNDNVPQFNYTDEAGIPALGSVVVSEPTTIRYSLVDETGKGLKITGAAFTAPFNNVIDDVVVSADGMSIELIDYDAATGKTGFRFVLSAVDTRLMILSPDPEVINRGNEV
ncbi:hypothetical protein CXF83_20425 [Shewanella sp. Choline-02u-19]|uniref:DP-EP family protein n=1 Tax=unclassified Shewanella TaxID=196818 RepID=UPI000C341675|nr:MULTISPECIES: DP-EP family protein [unclassified Shewanella]PKH53849.1 hypothetical protein CXF84_21495 [Shewanella sp. Bg11-22]PKI28899.1 hypothetical protein CXF83_20425 [Shewanella sp. Choline-02u-19]